MRVIVLNTGRCGSTTFIKACSHFSNFTAGHESFVAQPIDKRFDFPDQHIEADNRLAWQLGLLDKKFGKDAFYVHLIRRSEAVAKSYAKRAQNCRSIIRAYSTGISQADLSRDPYSFAMEMVVTINSNISHFLQDKPNKISVRLESVAIDFPKFCTYISAAGDLISAQREWSVKYNASSK